MGQCASELATERPKRRVAAPSIGSRRSRARSGVVTLTRAGGPATDNHANPNPAPMTPPRFVGQVNAALPVQPRVDDDEDERVSINDLVAARAIGAIDQQSEGEGAPHHPDDDAAAPPLYPAPQTRPLTQLDGREVGSRADTPIHHHTLGNPLAPSGDADDSGAPSDAASRHDTSSSGGDNRVPRKKKLTLRAATPQLVPRKKGGAEADHIDEEITNGSVSSARDVTAGSERETDLCSSQGSAALGRNSHAITKSAGSLTAEELQLRVSLTPTLPLASVINEWLLAVESDSAERSEALREEGGPPTSV